jgi:AcrR family transcriptional regulator
MPTGMARTKTAEQLPRGRHGLSRDQVLASQRDRMLDALCQAVAEKGYAETAVADVIERAGVSRETFYEHFAGKEDCFLSAYELASVTLQEAIADVVSTGGADPLDQFDSAMAAYLQTMSEQRAYARVFLVDVYAAGPAALSRRFRVFQSFVDTIVEIFGVRTASGRALCEALVGAVSSLVTVRVAVGEFDELPRLRGEIRELARRLDPRTARPKGSR